MSDMDKQRKLVLYKSPTYRVRISPSTLLSLSFSSFSSFSPSTSSDDILISKALNMATLRSYGSHSSLPQATSNLPSVAQAASSTHSSLDGVSVSNTFGVDNDTPSQHITRARMTLKEDIDKLRDESTRRLNTIETDIESIRLTLDQHDEKFTSIETRLTSVETRLTSVETRLTSVETRLTSIETRLTSIEQTSQLRYDTIQKQISGLSDSLEAISLHLKMRTSVDNLPSSQITDNTTNAATQLIPQISRSSPPWEPIQISRDHIRAPSDPPSPGPSTRRLPHAERVDFPVNLSEVDVHQLLSEARVDTGPETKHAVKGLLQNFKTVIRRASSKSLKSSKSVKSFKSTN
ncbi:hypothetical protein HETIRDRAFT_444393 [Heterobasidion irregulare TC 32-1]|uniref:Uncharacterized protein n=1 Tax=Heterobasidion irregulare (strain TC 32-1) TaxID=747525 RepID=W4K955_HETIT|nr:uncharacterized protein HETIRDRAFT_444393 [Heterobasidion irregulare TC 32-1]ETW82362.1 hypothetical protein HETIRDRAFT_444393 [Heterobasidion irregulare TC 32-1]